MPATKKEQFLQDLQALLSSSPNQTPKQQEIAKAIYDGVKARLDQNSESTLSDVFAAMQTVVDKYKGQMDEYASENADAAEKKKTEVLKLKFTQAELERLTQKRGAPDRFPITGNDDVKYVDKIKEIGGALTQVLNQDMVDQLVEKAKKADIPYTPDQALTLDTSYDKTVIDEVIRNFNIGPYSHGSAPQVVPTPKRSESHSLPNVSREGRTYVIHDPVDGWSETLSGIMHSWIVAKKGTKFTLEQLDKDGKTIFPQTPIVVNHSQLNKLIDWEIKANNFPIGHGVDPCTGRKFTYPIISAGEEIVMPDGTKIVPELFSGSRQCDISASLMQAGDKAGGVITVVPKENKLPPKSTPYVPTEYFTQASYSSNSVPDRDGNFRWQVGSVLHALEAMARSGVNPEFTKEWYALHNIVPRIAINKEKFSGQIENHDLEGSYRGKNKQSRLDDKETKRDNLNGGQKHRKSNGTKGEVFVAGYDVVDDKNGDFIRDRNTREITFYLDDKNNAFTIGTPFGPILVPTGPISVPWVMISKPGDQHPLVEVTGRGGLSEVNASLANLNFAGKSAIFSSERAQKTNPFASAPEIYASMFLQNSQNKFQESMQTVVSASTDEQKKTAAITALTALRDAGQNMLIHRIDAMRQPLAKTREAVIRYFKEQGLNTDEIEAAVKTAPHLAVHDMDQSLKEQLPGYKEDKDGIRYGDIKPGGHEEFYRKLESMVYLIENSVELKVATGQVPLVKEADAIDLSKKNWDILKEKPEAMQVFTRLIKNGDGNSLDHNAQMAAGSLLHDMLRNPQNYFTEGTDAKGKKQKPYDKAVAFVEKFFPEATIAEEKKADLVKTDGEIKQFEADLAAYKGDKKGREALKDKLDYAKERHKKGGYSLTEEAKDEIMRQGNTTPLPGVKDKPFPLSRPEIFGPAIGTAIEKNPQLLTDMIDRAMDPAFNGDGRRYGIAMVSTIARQRPTQGEDGVIAPGLSSLNTLFKDDADKKTQINDGIEKMIVYSESLARGVNMQMVQQYDNAAAVTNLQISDKEKGLTPDIKLPTIAEQYEKQTTVKDADGNTQPNEVAVEALAAHPALSNEIVLRAMIAHPEVFDPIKAKLRDYASTVIGGGRYKALARMLDNAQEAVHKYQTSPEPKDPKMLEDVVQTYTRYFTKMEANATSNRGLLRENAWAQMFHIAAKDPAAAVAFLDAAKQDEGLLDASIRAVGANVAYTSRLSVGTHGHVQKDDRVASTDSDDVYVSKLYQFHKNDKNEVLNHKKFLGIQSGIFGRYDVIINKDALAELAKQVSTTPGTGTGGDQTTQANANLNLGTGNGTSVEQQAGGKDGKEKATLPPPTKENTLQLNLTPEQQAQFDKLLAGANIGDQKLAHVMHMEDKIILGVKNADKLSAADLEQAKAEALAAWLEKKNPLLAKDKEGKHVDLVDAAKVLLQAKDKSGKPLLAVSVNGQGLLEAIPNSEGLAETLANAENLGATRGINPIIFIPFLPWTKTIYVQECGGCAPIPLPVGGGGGPNQPGRIIPGLGG